MQLLQFSHINLTLNGHRFVGWANEDPPVDWEFEEAAELEDGPDGGVYGSGVPRFGGIMVAKVQPASPSAQWCMQQEQLRKNAHRMRTRLRVYSGTYSDPVQNVSWALQGGIILMFPAVSTAKKTYEARMRFEVITATVDGGRFHAPLVSDAVAAA